MIAIATGGGSGIGRATFRHLTADGVAGVSPGTPKRAPQLSPISWATVPTAVTGQTFTIGG